MTTQAATTFFALLSLLVAATAVAIAGLAATGRRALVERHLGASAMWLAWLVATTATLGSLYYSEVVGLPPCELCWYQRIGMYPLVVVLGLAAWRGDVAVRRYAVPLAGLGGAVAAYHYQLEWFPSQEALACSLDVPCAVPWFRELGFVSLPFMALAAFAGIVALLLVASPAAPGSGTGEAGAEPVAGGSELP